MIAYCLSSMMICPHAVRPTTGCSCRIRSSRSRDCPPRPCSLPWHAPHLKALMATKLDNPCKKYPEFFKVFIPAHSSERLHIPPAFTVHFNGFILEKAILRSRRGNIWHVDVDKTETDMFFHNGWKRFVKDNCLLMGEFLVFRYVGSYTFELKIFGKTGCERTEIGASGSAAVKISDGKEEEKEREVREEEVAVDEGDDEEEDEEEEEEKEVEEDFEEEEEDFEEEEDEEDDEYDSFTDDDYYGSEDYDDENDDDHGDSGKTREKKMQKKPIRGCKRRDTKFFHRKKNCRTKKTYAFKLDEKIDIVVENYVQYMNPYFVTRIRQSRRNAMYIPAEVIKDNDLKLPPNITIHDSNGKTWSAKVVVWKDGRHWIQRGWRAFCKWNKLTYDDICIVEFLKVKGKWGSHVHVHFVRSNVGRACKPESL